MVFTNKKSSGYENMVNRRLAAEGKDPSTFAVGPRIWGTRIEGTPFIEHKGEQYLEVIFLRPGKTHYVHGVRPIDKANIIGLPEATAGEQGGLANKVIIRTFSVSSIKGITIDGQHHVL